MSLTYEGLPFAVCVVSSHHVSCFCLLQLHTQSERRHGQHQKCSCPDPSVPLANPDKEWKKHHSRLVEDAKRAPNKLDIVFVGDEIIEQWNGTADLGTTILKGGMREPFEKRFTTKGGGTIEGIALGSSIDTVRQHLCVRHRLSVQSNCHILTCPSLFFCLW